MRNASLPKLVLVQHDLQEEHAVRMLYETANVYIHPSRSEGWGLGIAEAMAHGLPPMIPEFGSPLEFVPRDASYMFPALRCVERS